MQDSHTCSYDVFSYSYSYNDCTSSKALFVDTFDETALASGAHTELMCSRLYLVQWQELRTAGVWQRRIVTPLNGMNNLPREKKGKKEKTVRTELDFRDIANHILYVAAAIEVPFSTHSQSSGTNWCCTFAANLFSLLHLSFPSRNAWCRNRLTVISFTAS